MNDWGIRSVRLSRQAAICVGIVVAWWGGFAAAQTTPRIDYFWPSGAARGSEVEVQVAGEFAPDDVRLDVVGPGLEVVRSLGRLRYLLRVASDATPGPRELRLVATQGASSPFPFMIGDLPVVLQSALRESAANSLPLRTVIQGRLTSPSAMDEYPLDLKAGQSIVCVVQSRLLRSPLEPTLRLVDATGRVVAVSVDARSADAVLTYRAQTSESLKLQVLDFQGNGSPAHLYQLLVTDGPWLDSVFPWTLETGKESPVLLKGWNFPGAETSAAHTVSAQSPGNAAISFPGAVNSLKVVIGEGSSIQEVEPNDAIDKAQAVQWPTCILGHFASRGDEGDQDIFEFAAKKAETIVFDVDAADMQSPADAVLTVFDAMGKKLVEQDDFEGSRDPWLRFTPPADGQYRLAIRDRSWSGGPDYAYQIQVYAPRPDVKARVNTMSLYVEASKKASLPVVVQRLEGFSGELQVTAVDLPMGMTATVEKVPEKTPATVTLQISAENVRGAAGGLARVVVRGGEGVAIEKEAVIAESPAPTSPTTQRLWVAAGPVIPFSLKTTTTILEAPRMAAFPFPVQVERLGDFVGPIKLVGVEPDRRGTVRPLSGEIPANGSTGAIPLVIQHQVTEGTTHRCRVMGIAEVEGSDGKSYQVFHVAPGAMAMGCEPSWLSLLANPMPATWRPGGQVSVTLTWTQRVQLDSISFRLEPPAGVRGVECEPVVVSAGVAQARLELRFAAEVVLPPRAVFTVKAESTHRGLPVFGETAFRLDRD
jgi:hypothetical protein